MNRCSRRLHRFVRKDESVFYGRVQATAVRDDTGSLSYFLGVFEDVTAEIEATSALKASEARLRAIIDNSPDIIAVLYPSGHWEASRQSTRLLGYPNGYVVDGGLYALIHPDDGPTAAVALSEVLAGTRSPKEPIELRLRAFDGNYWTFECVGQNLGARRRRRRCRRHGPQRHRTQAGGTPRTARPKSGSVPRSSTRRCACRSSISTAASSTSTRRARRCCRGRARR